MSVLVKRKIATNDGLDSAISVAQEVFTKNLRELPEKHPANRLLEERVISREWAEFFGIGFDNGTLDLDRTKEQLYWLTQLGIHNAKLKDHITFPVHDWRGGLVGFTGRAITAGEFKWMHIPSTQFYSRSDVVYNLHRALTSIREKGFAVIVEGPFDVTSLFMHGVTNVVSCLGTLFSRDHARILSRFTQDVVMLLDNDSAGEKGVKFGAPKFQEFGICVKKATLQGISMDPDKMVRTEGIEPVIEAIQRAAPL